MENEQKTRWEKFRFAMDTMMGITAWHAMVMLQSLRSLVPSDAIEYAPPYREKIDDRRLSRRLHVNRRVIFQQEGYAPQDAYAVNISRRGMYLETGTPLDEGQEISLNLRGEDDTRLPMVDARVVRRSMNGMAVRFI